MKNLGSRNIPGVGTWILLIFFSIKEGEADECGIGQTGKTVNLEICGCVRLNGETDTEDVILGSSQKPGTTQKVREVLTLTQDDRTLRPMGRTGKRHPQRTMCELRNF